MSKFVIDASVAVKWFIREKGTVNALEILDQLTSFYAPEIFLLEIDSTLSKKVRRHELNINDAFEIRLKFRKLPYKLIGYKEIEEFAFHLAAECSITLYDATYLATAIDYEAKLYTADIRLFNGLSNTPFSKYVVYVG